MFDQLKNFWAGLSPRDKLIYAAVAIVITWYAVVKFKAYKVAVESNIKKKTESQVLAANGITKTYTDSQYTNWAQFLYDKMNGPGTYDETGIANVFKYQKNNADFLALEKAFGLRKSSYDFFGDPTDMRAWLKGDLSQSFISEINQQLKIQGITKQI